jgi:hypothetical protein
MSHKNVRWMQVSAQRLQHTWLRYAPTVLTAQRLLSNPRIMRHHTHTSATCRCVCLQWWAKEFAALLPRVEFVVGDMFQPSTLPCPRPGLKTCYVLKQILHDWSDTDSLAILTAIRAVIAQEVGGTACSSKALLAPCPCQPYTACSPCPTAPNHRLCAVAPHNGRQA